MTGRHARTSPETLRRVTRLRELKGGRVEVELDDVPWRTLPADAVVRAGLLVGRELDRPTARALGRELRRSEALHTAGRALRARDLSAKALDERLARKSVAPAVRADAVETLQRAGLVDDDRFAAGRAEALAGRGYGDAAIRADLERQGLDGEAAEVAVTGLEPEAARAARIAGRRGRTAATARYLAARGFDPDALEAALGGLVAGDP
jgi:SOS response regulatory protein OraA/RecX